MSIRPNPSFAVFTIVAFVVFASCGPQNRQPREGDYSIAYEGIDCSDPAIRWGETEMDCQAFVALYNAFDGKQWYGTNKLDLRNNSDFRLTLAPDLGVGGEIPEEIDQLENLGRFVLQGVRIDGFPEAFFDLDIKWMTFRHNGLETLPVEMGRMPELRDIHINNNGIVRLAPELFQWPRVEQVDFARNQLQEIPAEVGKLTSLTSLNLADNQLRTLPAELGQLKNVKSLNLANNELGSLPAEIADMESLTHLNLAGNPLMSVPAAIWNMKSLKELDLSETALASFPDQVSPRITIRLRAVDVDIPDHVRPDRVVRERETYKTWNQRAIEAVKDTWTIEKATVLDLLTTDSYINGQPCINVKVTYESGDGSSEIFVMICTNPANHRLLQPGEEIELLMDPRGEERPIIYRSKGRIVI
ncbi:MAG: leucine-rich repeat domain-containing protein [Bacteroidota bacterium]